MRPRVFKVGDPGIPVGSVYIGRGSPWGNPFKVGKHGTRAQVIERFRREVLPDLDLTKLRGHHLICHCAPQACHGDAILWALGRRNVLMSQRRASLQFYRDRDKDIPF